MTESDAKAALRRRLLEARAAHAARGQAALDRALLEPSRPWFSPRYRTIAVYAALEAEASLDALLRPLHRDGAELVFPRTGPQELSFAACAPTQLVPARFGLREPPSTLPEVPPEAIDLFLVPGVGFTERGERIGFGRGYYDRLLSRASPRAPTVGVGFEVQLCETLPTEAHDVRLDGLVTEAGFRWRAR